MPHRASMSPARSSRRPPEAMVAPARCSRCGTYAVMPVRRVRRKTWGRTWYMWQVGCRQCGKGWSSGYPLIDPT